MSLFVVELASGIDLVKCEAANIKFRQVFPILESSNVIPFLKVHEHSVYRVGWYHLEERGLRVFAEVSAVSEAHGTDSGINFLVLSHLFQS